MHATLDLQTFAIGGGINSQDFSGTKSVLTRPNIVKTSFGNDANLLGALYQLLH